MCGAFIYQIAARLPLELNIERDRKALYRETTEGLIENTFTLQILNKGQQDTVYLIAVDGIDNYEYIGDKQVLVKSGEAIRTPISIAIDPYDLKKPITDMKIVITTEDGEYSVEEETRFFKGR